VLEPADKPAKQPRLVTPLRIKVEGRKEEYETYEDLDEIVARWAECLCHDVILLYNPFCRTCVSKGRLRDVLLQEI
jgi:hypothetical protein